MKRIESHDVPASHGAGSEAAAGGPSAERGSREAGPGAVRDTNGPRPFEGDEVANMSGHTPGPWEVLPESDSHEGPLNIVSEYEEKGGRASANWIAECDLQSDEAQNRANARLIAAAPDLLEALRASVAATDRELEAFRRNLGRNPLVMPEWLAGARAAIAKAEGR